MSFYKHRSWILWKNNVKCISSRLWLFVSYDVDDVSKKWNNLNVCLEDTLHGRFISFRWHHLTFIQSYLKTTPNLIRFKPVNVNWRADKFCSFPPWTEWMKEQMSSYVMLIFILLNKKVWRRQQPWFSWGSGVTGNQMLFKICVELCLNSLIGRREIRQCDLSWSCHT